MLDPQYGYEAFSAEYEAYQATVQAELNGQNKKESVKDAALADSLLPLTDSGRVKVNGGYTMSIPTTNGAVKDLDKAIELVQQAMDLVEAHHVGSKSELAYRDGCELIYSLEDVLTEAETQALTDDRRDASLAGVRPGTGGW